MDRATAKKRLLELGFSEKDAEKKLAEFDAEMDAKQAPAGAPAVEPPKAPKASQAKAETPKPAKAEAPKAAPAKPAPVAPAKPEPEEDLVSVGSIPPEIVYATTQNIIRGEQMKQPGRMERMASGFRSGFTAPGRAAGTESVRRGFAEGFTLPARVASEVVAPTGGQDVAARMGAGFRSGFTAAPELAAELVAPKSTRFRPTTPLGPPATFLDAAKPGWTPSEKFRATAEDVRDRAVMRAAVEQNPARFGLTPDEVNQLNEDHIGILLTNADARKRAGL